MGSVDSCARNYSAVLQHVLEVYKVTVVHVLGEVVGIVEVNKAFIVSLYDILVEKEAFCDVF